MHILKRKKITIGASISCANLFDLKSEFKQIEKSGIDFIHYDVIDGSFNDTFILGIPTLKAIRSHTDLPIEVHLAVCEPEKFINQFVDAGADYLAVHYEAMDNPKKIFNKIMKLNAKPILALRADTRTDNKIKNLLPLVDWVLKLAVNPGYSGQNFQYRVLSDIKELGKSIDSMNIETGISVDGNINVDTIPNVVKSGGNILVGGSSGLFINDLSVVEAKNLLLDAGISNIL